MFITAFSLLDGNRLPNASICSQPCYWKQTSWEMCFTVLFVLPSVKGSVSKFKSWLKWNGQSNSGHGVLSKRKCVCVCGVCMYARAHVCVCVCVVLGVLGGEWICWFMFWRFQTGLESIRRCRNSLFGVCKYTDDKGGDKLGKKQGRDIYKCSVLSVVT